MKTLKALTKVIAILLFTCLLMSCFAALSKMGMYAHADTIANEQSAESSVDAETGDVEEDDTATKTYDDINWTNKELLEYISDYYSQHFSSSEMNGAKHTNNIILPLLQYIYGNQAAVISTCSNVSSAEGGAGAHTQVIDEDDCRFDIPASCYGIPGGEGTGTGLMGVRVYMCSYCGHVAYYCFTSALTSHTYITDSSDPDYSKYVNLQAQYATCINPGEIKYYCTVCHTVYKVETEAATGHNEDYKESDQLIQKPTCTESGWYYHLCGNVDRNTGEACTEKIYDEEILASGHTWGDLQTSQVLINNVTRQKITLPEDSEINITAAFLDEQIGITSIPNQTNNSNLYNDCLAVYIETDKACTVCGGTDNQYFQYTCTGHDWQDLVFYDDDGDVLMDKDGWCTNADSDHDARIVYMDSEGKAHWLTSLSENTLTSYSVYEDYEYETSQDVDGNTVVTPLYDSDGNLKTTGVWYKVQICSKCGKMTQNVTTVSGNFIASGIISVFEDYQQYLLWALLIVAALWTGIMGISYITAVKEEDRVKAKKRIVNYVVGLIVICVVLCVVPALVYGIAVWIT